jgi:hypothetical protein
MQEMPLPGEHHGHPSLVGRRDDLWVAAGSAGLYDGPDPCPGSNLYAIGLWKEGVRSEHRTPSSLSGTLYSDLDRCYPRRLSGAHANEAHRAGVSRRFSPDKHNGIRLNMARCAPSETEGRPFTFIRRPARDDLCLADLNCVDGVTLLHENAACDTAPREAWAAGVREFELEHAQACFRGKQCKGFFTDDGRQ